LASKSDNKNPNAMQYINIAHINIHSVRSKFHLINNHLNTNNYEILCLTETLLKTDMISPIFCNYDLVRKDRTIKGGGGIAILLKNNLKHSIISIKNETELALSPNIEYLCMSVQLQPNQKSFTIVCIYRSPNYSNDVIEEDFYTLSQILAYVMKPMKSVYIVGDFNLSNDRLLRRLETLLESIGLKQFVCDPTRVNSILDLFISNRNDINISVNDPHLSDHLLVNASIPVKKIKKIKNTITYRNVNINNMTKTAYKIVSLDNIMTGVTVDEKLSSFACNIVDCINEFSKIKKRNTCENKHKKYLSETSLDLVRQRNEAYKAYKTKPTIINKIIVNILNKFVSKAIKKDTVSKVNIDIEKIGVYKTVNNIINIGKSKSKLTVNLNSNMINDYFVSLNTTNEREIIIPKKHCNLKICKNTFIVQTVSLPELFKAWKMLKKRNSKSIDALGLCPFYINHLIHAPVVYESLLEIINDSIAQGYVCDSLKVSKVIPIPK